MEESFNPGAIPDRADSRDYQYHKMVAGASLFDWQAGYDVEDELGVKLVTKDQNGSYSCGGQAWAYYGEVLSTLNDGKYDQKSAKFIYSQTFWPGGGSIGRDNSDLCVKQGWADEAICPSYENGAAPTEVFMTRRQDITDEARTNAKKDKAFVYANVPVDVDILANAIKLNHGIIIGITGTNNGTWYSLFPQAPTAGASVWRHWLYAGKAKLINGKRYIGVKNSWGNQVGDNGWQWISEDYINSPLQFDYCPLIFNVWTLTFKPFQFNSNLFFGLTSEDVKQLQLRLGVVPVTGFFGPKTFAAVRAYQTANGIPSTGFVGSLTRAKLNSYK